MLFMIVISCYASVITHTFLMDLSSANTFVQHRQET